MSDEVMSPLEEAVAFKMAALSESIDFYRRKRYALLVEAEKVLREQVVRENQFQALKVYTAWSEVVRLDGQGEAYDQQIAAMLDRLPRLPEDPRVPL